ncbi:hypothetical protein NFI96_013628 [Prochilodus magdalenae]|nr:hypothetical protein NFI96_013628 [Prochilodus magdalenae]
MNSTASCDKPRPLFKKNKKIMAFMVKHMIGGQLKDLTGGLGEEKPEAEKSEAAAKGMTQEEFEEYQQQLAEEKLERDASFAQKKAERATIRSHFREKYRLPKSELDETQIQAADKDVELPTELAKMIAEDNQEEEHKQSVLGQLASIQNVDVDQLKDKAQATLEDLKQSAEKCEELHAHLNGSVSFETMEKLITRKPHLNIEHSMTAIRSGQRRTLDECFQVFKVIHQLVDSEEDVLMVAKAVIQEFAADGVKYLELRSTPREEPKTGLSKKGYIESVIEAIRQCKQEGADIDVRFLVAIDRRNGPEVAMETVKLAEDFMLSSDGVIVGLDLSGDPKFMLGLKKVGHGKDLLPALQRAKNCGLKLALHLSEVPSQKEETELLLDLPPDRIGHGTFLHPEVGGSDRLVDKVCKQNIPIELCLTSNIKGQTVPSYDKHHFQFWYERGHPCVLCTDDKGVFCTDLSQEYQLAASTFGLSQEAVWVLSQQAIQFSFAPEALKQQLKQKWAELRPHVLQEYSNSASVLNGSPLVDMV